MYAEEWRLRRTKTRAYSCCEAHPPLRHASRPPDMEHRLAINAKALKTIRYFEFSVCRSFTRRATDRPNPITLVWPTPPPTVTKASDGTWFAIIGQLPISVRRRGSFACPQ